MRLQEFVLCGRKTGGFGFLCCCALRACWHPRENYPPLPLSAPAAPSNPHPPAWANGPGPMALGRSLHAQTPPSLLTPSSPAQPLPLLKTKPGYFIAETAKGYIRAPIITRKRSVPGGKTAPFRSIGWVPAPAPFPTSERGRDSQRDRLNQPRVFEPDTSSFRGGRFAHCATWTPYPSRVRVG